MPDNLTPLDGTEEQDPVAPQADPTPEAVDPEPQIEEPEPPTEPSLDTGPAPAPAPAAPAEPSLEERYRNQRSEAMILNTQKKNLESTLNQLTSEDTPTEPELLTEYPEYKDYNGITQKLMRDTLENKKRQMRINRQLIEQEAERRWDTELRQLIRKPEYATLKTDEKFEEFVLQPKYKGVDIQTLADAYLVRSGRSQPVEPTEPVNPAPQPRSSGLPRGAGGPRTPVKPAKITLEQAATLRQTNYKEYMRQLRAGNIEELV